MTAKGDLLVHKMTAHSCDGQSQDIHVPGGRLTFQLTHAFYHSGGILWDPRPCLQISKMLKANLLIYWISVLPISLMQ